MSIYLDHAATTPVDPAVAEAMRPYLTEAYGNPSSIHAAGRQARAALDAARDTLAAALNVEYGEIYFTGSGTEADNLALLGTMLSAPPHKNHLIVGSTEHHAVLHTAQALERQGFALTVLPVDAEGFIPPESLAKAITDRTALVSLMHANNEIGTVQDIAALSAVTRERGVLFHTDAVQTFGSLPVDAPRLGVDLLTVSAHKLYGPKGVGALYIRTGVKVSPLLFGGTQEREKRAGTENVAGVVGFAKAVKIAEAIREDEAARLTGLRDTFLADLLASVPGLCLNGARNTAGEAHIAPRLPNNVNVSIADVEGIAVLMNLDRAGVAASSGSACSSGSLEPSHVLKALGLSDELAASGVRFTLGRTTTACELAETVEILATIVRRLRGAGK